MATLVLTAVGTAIGGPLGGAIGALVGRSVDGALLRPTRREGPRLTELAVQTSSYGSQIPTLFGTIRVAGTVIWATDLIESRSTARGGKGQPSVSTYSYAASFAVLLSARAIRGVGRIWAEGKLLRGAGGDFKTATGFRLHPGGEDQAVDPLIASAHGIGLTPAHRGCAYAVFEQMQLAEYGNRIPSLTFEVIADDGAVPVAMIARTLAAEVTGETALALDGFAAAEGSVGAVLATLGQASGAWFAPEGAGLTMRDAAIDPVAIADAGYAADGRGTRRTRTVAAIETVPVRVTIGHYDAARDYQTGSQRATRPGAGVRDERIELPAVIAAGVAKTLAVDSLARAESARVRRTVTTAFDGMAVAPGRCVTIEGETGMWRVAESLVEAMVTKLVLVRVEPGSIALTASSGQVAGAVDVPIGATLLRAFETPGLDDTPLSAPRLTVAATGAGAGWRQAALLYSTDDGARWEPAGATAAPAVIGTVVVPARAAPATLVDRAGTIEVALARGDMMLGDADDAALDRGANLALIGEELVQFARAVPLGGGRWRLSGLWRGRRGTEAAIASQAAGARFVLIEADAARAIDLPVAAIGRTVRVLASGVGDTDPVEARVVVTGVSVMPPSPVHASVSILADGGAVVRWTRRSRAGWRWIDGVDAPIGEEAEAYRVTITGGSARVAETAEPLVTIAAAERAAGALWVEIRQRGTFGESPPTRITVPAKGGRA